VSRDVVLLLEDIENLPLDWRQKHSDISWRAIAGLRDFVAHVYFALDLDILWNAIQQEVPNLLRRVEELLREERV
jgi:uncharacterized protein with HEPN domain